MTTEEGLRALTVRQPHAWAIIEGHKDVENRSWRFPLPLGSTIAIHAGRKHDPAGLTVTPTAWGQPVQIPSVADMATGCIVGFVDVVDDVEDHPSPWALPGSRHWVLANPRRVAAPVECRGHLWLFRVPDDVAASLSGRR